jgi:DegV family protein with EDD domain
MNIKIISDSTCDLPRALVEKYNISIFPLTVIKNGENFRDNETITPADIFAHVAAGGALCSTAAGNVGEYEELFARYAADYDGVVHVNIGSGFSSSYQNACLAASEFDNVIVIDSQNLSTGQGLIVLKAAQLASEATDLQQLKASIEAFVPKVESSFVLDQLKYMAKGGRCSSVAALGANLLNLKPCIEVRDGKMSVVKKYRGSYSKCLANYVKDRLAGREDIDPETLFLTYTPVTNEDLAAVKSAIAEHGSFFSNIYEAHAGCTVCCHCGPGTLGVLFIRK